jgi:hypothetical protein
MANVYLYLYKTYHILSKGSLAIEITIKSPHIIDSLMILTKSEILDTRSATPLSIDSYLQYSKVQSPEISINEYGYIPHLFVQGSSRRIVVFFTKMHMISNPQHRLSITFT